MPNWCKNYVVVRGKAEDLKQMMFSCTSREINHPDYDKEAYLFTLLLEKDIEIREDDGCYLDFNLVVPLPKGALKQPAYTNWGQDSEKANWGVKWGACDCDLDYNLERSDPFVSYTFDTAWSNPETFFFKWSEQYPTLTFDCLTESSESDFIYHVIYKKGRSVETIEDCKYYDKYPEEAYDGDE